MKFPTKLIANKFYISSQVHDSFRELTNDEKWEGIKGEYTSSPGFQFWKRIKEVKNKLIVINSSKNNNDVQN